MDSGDAIAITGVHLGVREVGREVIPAFSEKDSGARGSNLPESIRIDEALCSSNEFPDGAGTSNASRTQTTTSTSAYRRHF